MLPFFRRKEPGSRAVLVPKMVYRVVRGKTAEELERAVEEVAGFRTAFELVGGVSWDPTHGEYIQAVRGVTYVKEKEGDPT